jgi:hypothetical protein
VKRLDRAIELLRSFIVGGNPVEAVKEFIAELDAKGGTK